MPDVVQNVVINFETNDEGLKPAVDQLAKLGQVETQNADAFKAANTEILNQAKRLDTLSQSGTKVAASGNVIKKTLSDVTTVINSMGQSFQDEIAKGANDALREAGVSAEEFEAALKHATEVTTSTTKSLKQQLKEMTTELSNMKVAGQDNTEQYELLAEKAGQLKDAIGDANQEVKNFASDTSTFDGLIQGVQGLAGGFAVVQGATALFGDESEELQKTLLKVNAAMAILQGLQQIQVVLQKESAISQLANTLATKGQVIAQTALNFVVGTSTGLMKAFRIALAATGIGLLVVGVIALYEALKNTNNSLEEANKLIDRENELLSLNTETIKGNVDINVARAEAIDAAESEIIKIRGKGLQQQRAITVASTNLLITQRDAIDPTSEAWFKLNDAIIANNDAIKGLDQQILIASINLEKQLADERKKALEDRAKAQKEADEKAKKAAEDASAKAKEQRAADFADFKAKKELELLATQKGSEEELAAKKGILRAELQVDLNNDKLTLNQRKLLIQNFFKQRLDLDKQYGKDQVKLAQENAIAESQAVLNQLEVSNQDRLIATEFIIEEQAQLEIAAAEGNAIKIRAIAAKRDSDIRAARIASIESEVQYEIDLATATNGPAARKLQVDIDNTKLSLDARKSAIDQLAELDNSATVKRIQALNDELAQGLISQRDYDLKYAQLVDQGTKVYEDAEKKKTAITEEESKKRQEQLKKDIQTAVDVAGQAVQLLGSFYDADNERQKQQLEGQRERVKELLEAGAITEKEALVRNKRIEAEEKRQKQQQAERDKRIQLFQALLAIPSAFLQGLAQGGPILGAIYASIAAVQAGIIAARKVPKFARGKKDNYQGPGVVGEAGAELIEQNGRMWVADAEQLVWLNRKDKVYNPRETANMLGKAQMSTERGSAGKAGKNGMGIDYKRMGKEIGKHLKTDVYVDGVQAQRIEKQLIETYQYKRRQAP